MTDWRSDHPQPEQEDVEEQAEIDAAATWRADKPDPEPEEMSPSPDMLETDAERTVHTMESHHEIAPDRPQPLERTFEETPVVGHFKPEAEGLGLDGSTPSGGIEGRATRAGSHAETPRNEYDWQPNVEVDQPVQEG